MIVLLSTSRSFVKKKAALTLLRLYRKHPDVIPAAEWALRIVSIMDDQNLVMSTCLSCAVVILADALFRRSGRCASSVKSGLDVGPR